MVRFVAVAVLALLATAMPVRGQTTTYNVVLEGYQQVGPYVDTPATGGGTATFNAATKQLSLNLAHTAFSSSGARIHGPAPRGQNAPVLFTLAAGNPIVDVVVLDAAKEAMLLAGQLYVSLPSVVYPDGQLRGQIDNLGATVLHTLSATEPPGGTIQGGTEAGNNLLNCGTRCSMQVPHGALVTLYGVGGPPGHWVQWGGSCAGTADGEDCEFVMDGAKAVSATFVPLGGVDVSATMTAAPNPAVVGQDVTFTITLSNAGPGSTDEPGFELEVPAGLAFVSAATGCTHYPAEPDYPEVVYCEAGKLAQDASKQMSVVLRPTAAGTITVVAEAYAGDADYDASNNDPALDLVVDPGGRMSNISTRMQVGTGNDVLIGGFVIGGSAAKRVAIVATGPSLAPFGIANPLANPSLTLVRSSDQAVIATNEDWQAAANQGELTAAGLAPSNALEAAILVDLAPGAYTAIVQGAGGATGVSVIGVYEVDHPEIPLINISTRGRVLTGNDVMIGGFVVSGAAPKTVAVVATGPSLAAFGIASPLANPTISLVRSSDQAVIATNDDWQADANSAQLQAAGLAPSNALEAALYVTLPPGAYTAIVQGAGGGTGVAVIGVYAVD